MHLHSDDGRHLPGLPGSSDSQRGFARLAAGVGLAGSSFLVLLTGLSELGVALGLPPWSAHLLSGAAGLAGAAMALRRLPRAGLTPAQALSQLRHDLDLASAAASHQRGPGSAHEARAFG